jgi:hypothetical protein
MSNTSLMPSTTDPYRVALFARNQGAIADRQPTGNISIFRSGAVALLSARQWEAEIGEAVRRCGLTASLLPLSTVRANLKPDDVPWSSAVYALGFRSGVAESPRR